jgi:hypothetical protein
MATTNTVVVMMDRQARNLLIPMLDDSEYRASDRLTRTEEVHPRRFGENRLNDRKLLVLVPSDSREAKD